MKTRFTYLFVAVTLLATLVSYAAAHDMDDMDSGSDSGGTGAMGHKFPRWSCSCHVRGVGSPALNLAETGTFLQTVRSGIRGDLAATRLTRGEVSLLEKFVEQRS